MSRLADPSICPDCRAPLDAARACRACGLRLEGPLAAELWQTMLSADRLVGRLRETAPVGVPSSPPVPPAPPPPPPGSAVPPRGLPAMPTLPRSPLQVAPRPPRLALSVPAVLLGLGGLCLLVFTAIFLAVAWDVLGLWGRSLVILAVTGVLAASASLVTVRGLRASAETLWVVVGLMLTFDLYAASGSGLLGGISARGTSSLVGGVLVVLGVGVTVWSRRRRTGALLGTELLAVLGLVVLTAAQSVDRYEWEVETASAVLVGALMLAAWPLQLLRLRWVAGGALVLAAGHWLVLVATGMSVAVLGGGTIWVHPLWWWSLGLAAAYAAAVALLPRTWLGTLLGASATSTAGARVAAVVRAAAASAALVAVLLVVDHPMTTDSPDLAVALASASQLALCALLVWGPTVWARGAAPLAGLGAIVLVGALLVQTGPAVALSTLGSPGAELDPVGPLHSLVWLLLGIVTATSLAALLGVRGPGLVGVYGAARPEARRDVATAGAVSAVALGAWSAVLATGTPLWTTLLAGLLAASATAWAAWWHRDRPVAAVAASAATLWIAGTAAWLAAAGDSSPALALVLTVVGLPLVVAGLGRDRAGAAPSAVVLAVGSALVLAWATAQWGASLGADGSVQSLLVAVVAAAVLLLARPVTRLAATRLALEAVSAPLLLAALLAGGDAETGSLVLTLAATALAVASVWHDDRRSLGLVAVVVAVLAFGWRAVAGLDVPELASLPAAVVLVAGGVVRMRRDQAVSSLRAVGAGLGLLLTPSLVLALGDPVSVRGAVVALVSVSLLAVGVVRRLGAPYVIGAVATAVLALRHLDPVADAVPRWMVIGLVGTALLVAGITWESGLRNVARARRYVVSLR